MTDRWRGRQTGGEVDRQVERLTDAVCVSEKDRGALGHCTHPLSIRSHIKVFYFLQIAEVSTETVLESDQPELIA